MRLECFDSASTKWNEQDREMIRNEAMTGLQQCVGWQDVHKDAMDDTSPQTLIRD